jgi:hypothetical protein
MLRNLFHIFVIAQVLIPFIMAHVPANREVGMAILYADGQRVPLTFRMEDNGLAYMTSQRLNSRFGFKEDTIVVDEDIFDVVTSEFIHTLACISHRDENNNMFWTLHSGSYRVYGLTKSQMAASTEILTPRSSSTCTIETPMSRDVKVKLEPSLETPIVKNSRVESVITFFQMKRSVPPSPRLRL